MTQLDSTNRIIALPNGTGLDIESIRRLIILVPGPEAELSSVSQRVCELANATGAHVIFLGLWSDLAEEPGLKRRLITLSAIAHSGHVSSDGDHKAPAQTGR